MKIEYINILYINIYIYLLIFIYFLFSIVQQRLCIYINVFIVYCNVIILNENTITNKSR